MLPVLLRHALLGVALAFFVELLLLVLFRIQYPYDLDWMEGAFVDHVRRALSAQPIYVKPSLEFTPFIYPPLYFYFSALISKMMGIGYLPLRLVSFAASVGSFVLIFQIVRRETRSTYYGVISSSLYAACFELGGAWFDLGRLDCLLVFFLLAGFYILRFYAFSSGACLAGATMALASFTKQSALMVAAPLCLGYFFVAGRRRGLFFAGSFVLLFAAGTGAMNYLNDGWYTFYVFTLPVQHAFVTPMLTYYWTHDLLRPLPVAFLLLFYFLYSRIKGWKGLSRDELDALVLQVTFLGATLVCAWLSRLHIGGGSNTVLPVYAAVALLFGIALQGSFLGLEERPGEEGTPTRRYRHETLRLLLYTAAIFQFGSLYYDPSDYLPTRGDVKAGDRFVRALSSIEGKIFAPDHGYLPFLAGKKCYPHVTTYWSVWAANDGKAKEDLDDELVSALREQRFAAVIVGIPWLTYPPLMKRIEKHYERQGAVVKGDWSFGPVNFKRLKVQFRPDIYLPR